MFYFYIVNCAYSFYQAINDVINVLINKKKIQEKIHEYFKNSRIHTNLVTLSD